MSNIIEVKSAPEDLPIIGFIKFILEEMGQFIAHN